MIGKNELIANKATLIEMAQEYINRRSVANKPFGNVTSVSFNINGGTVSFTLESREDEDKGNDD